MAQIETVVVPEQPSGALKAAVDDLLHLLQTQCGTTPKLVTAGDGHPKQALYLQRIADQREGGAFTIQRERSRVLVQSQDAEGWCNALYAIMNDLLGARWYWAGDLGFESLDPERAYFPNSPWREAPAFVQRRFYPIFV